MATKTDLITISRSDYFKLKAENVLMSQAIINFHRCGRRYLDGKSTDDIMEFNKYVRQLKEMRILFDVKGDGTIWARDSNGRTYDALSDKEALEGGHPSKIDRSLRSKEELETANGILKEAVDLYKYRANSYKGVITTLKKQLEELKPKKKVKKQ
jgi:hypothetical protein